MADDIYLIDATGLLVGRLATHAARAALHGKKVVVAHCEKAVISGQRRMVIEEWTHKYKRGVPMKGPFIDRIPDRFVRRIIRGMLPYKTARGREAYKNLRCHIGMPKDVTATPVVLKGASASKLPSGRSISVGKLCRELGGTWHE